MEKEKEVEPESFEVFNKEYLTEFGDFATGVRGIREKFILATGAVEKEIEEVISLVLFGRDEGRTTLFKDTIINREFFTIENKFEILTEIIEKGEIEIEKAEKEVFLEQIEDVIKMKKLFLHGDVVISDSSIRIHMMEKKTKIGRIIDEEFFGEVNELISGAVESLKDLGEFVAAFEEVEEVVEEEEIEEKTLEELSPGSNEDSYDDDEEIDDDDLDDDDGFKIDETDIWKEETGMDEEYTKDTAIDEVADLKIDSDDD